MFISLKRYLSGAEQELAESFQRMALLLLEAIRLHAVVGEPDEHQRFQQDIGKLESKLREDFSPQQVLVVAGAVAKTLETYNQRTTRFIRMQSAELQAMLAMLTETVAAISAGSDRTVARLQTIEKQLERASVIEDIRSLKAKLSECLLTLREEARKQREETARTIAELRNEIKRVQQRQNAVTPAKQNSACGSLGRAEAEAALARAIEQRTHTYAAIFVLERFDLISGRFGPGAAEQLSRFFWHHLTQGLLCSDAVYRWTNASFLVLMERSGALEEVRAEVQRVASVRLEWTLQLGTRTVLLPVSSRWAVLAVFQFPSLRLVLEEIETIVAGTAAALS
ncbi:MAG: hypothetical protein RMI94_01800 [Bryobacterales bacterium]|nr:hypothetical protein [Bryobacteraceae bacterium]MDW8129254.1 hypothetical protein [Bryobacterales bacterium]